MAELHTFTCHGLALLALLSVGFDNIIPQMRFSGIFNSLRTAASSAMFTILSIQAPGAWAWGAEAHRLIAEMAEQQLQPKAAEQVRRLLNAEPGATMASVSTWADEVRNRSDAHWHYVNLPAGIGCHYVSERDCPGKACVVGAIEQHLQVLGSNSPDAQRLKALKYVIHFIADVHQPLHAGHADDRGGNTFQVHAYGHGTNLHALWDKGLVVNWPSGIEALRHDIETLLMTVQRERPSAWAEESCRLVEQDWFYPDSHVLQADYMTVAKPVMIRQIKRAAHRLAAELNEALNR